MNNLKINRYPGKLIYRYSGEMVYYLDQLDWFSGIPYPMDPDDLTWEDSWIAANFMDRYLMKHYNIDSRMYWNLIHGFDINYHHICECSNCNNQTKFRSLWYGYHPTCSWDCRNQLQSEFMIDFYKTASEDEVQAFKDAQHQWWWKDYMSEFTDLAGIQRNILTRSWVVSTWNFKRFLQFGNQSDHCNFYIAKTSNSFKFGVSNSEYNKGWYKNYVKHKVILEGSRFEMACLEYLIKLDMNLDTEYIPWDRVLEFTRSYVNNLKLLFDTGSTTIETIRCNLNKE